MPRWRASAITSIRSIVRAPSSCGLAATWPSSLTTKKPSLQPSSRYSSAASSTDHSACGVIVPAYWSSTQAKICGATMVASDSMTNLGVSADSLPQVIFSFGTAPE